ncbi:MAG: hypothetical protein JWM25_65, partial [Thermoleophilia bacterium]|nr:hypothetical protein [Thermoleophilia bacterium]
MERLWQDAAMHFAASPTAPTASPSARAAAADRLVYVPGTALTLAERAAAARDAAGTPTSPAQLLRTLHHGHVGAIDVGAGLG